MAVRDRHQRNFELEAEKLRLELVRLELVRTRNELQDRQRRIDTNDAIRKRDHIGGYVI